MRTPGKKKKAPTNTELLLAIQRMRDEDSEKTNRRINTMGETILGLASKGDVAAVHTLIETTNKAIFDENSELKLATKADVQPVIDLYRKLTLSAQLVGTGGKWTSRLILGIAAILIALGVISGGIKGVLAAAIGWALGGAR